MYLPRRGFINVGPAPLVEPLRGTNPVHGLPPRASAAPPWGHDSEKCICPEGVSSMLGRPSDGTPSGPLRGTNPVHGLPPRAALRLPWALGFSPCEVGA